MIKDERMQSIKDQKEEEDQWFPIQILNAVHTTSSLPEDIQVDIMRVSFPYFQHAVSQHRNLQVLSLTEGQHYLKDY